MSLKKGHRHHTSTLHTTKKVLDQVRSEINVTPLVDVCLVLLIIFMIINEKLTRGMEVSLPKSKHHEEHRDTGEDLIVSVTKSGSGPQVYLDRSHVHDIDDLKKQVGEELGRRSRKVFVKADSDLNYGDVYPVLIAIHDVGAQGVQLGTAEIKENK